MTVTTRGRRRGAGLAIAAGLALAVPLAARAELVVLVDGAVLKVESYATRDDVAVLGFPGGGRLEMSIERVERVVDDEIEPARAGDERALDGAAFPLRFADGQAAPDTPWGPEIFAAARRHGLNPALVAAVVRAESAFDPRAVSRKGARGLMQLMPATGRRFGLRRSELFDPAKNLDAGARYLAWLADRFEDDLARTLAAYNAGEGAVDRFGGVPPYRETRSYVRSIFGRLGLASEDAASGRAGRPGR